MKGGRYDHLIQNFGKDVPSIGFVVVIDQLLAALSRQKLEVEVEHSNTMILYQESTRASAIQLARYYRNIGKNVEMTLKKEEKSIEEYEEMAKRNQIRRFVTLTEEKAVMKDLVSGIQKTGTAKALMEEEK